MQMMSVRAALNILRIAVILAGVPLLIYWATAEHARVLNGAFGAGILAGIVLSQCALLLYAMRFRQVLRLTGIDLAFWDNLRLITLSLFYQFFVPLSAGADLTKFITLKTRAHGSVKSALAIVLDHFVGLASLAGLSLSLFVIERPVRFELQTGLTMLGALVLAVAAGLGVLWWTRRHSTDVQSLCTVMVEQRAALAVAFVTSLAIHVTLAAAVWLAANALNIAIGYPQILFVITTAMMFPMSGHPYRSRCSLLARGTTDADATTFCRPPKARYPYRFP